MPRILKLGAKPGKDAMQNILTLGRGATIALQTLIIGNFSRGHFGTVLIYKFRRFVLDASRDKRTFFTLTNVDFIAGLQESADLSPQDQLIEPRARGSESHEAERKSINFGWEDLTTFETKPGRFLLTNKATRIDEVESSCSRDVMRCIPLVVENRERIQGLQTILASCGVPAGNITQITEAIIWRIPIR